ncbi:hypothetical protein MKX08_007973 [Trichoderma sp. CBMAI-0020]|nr:hypothetical protein MKX08_007973 [Trichoderma sp. CBMAI-0020]
MSALLRYIAWTSSGMRPTGQSFRCGTQSSELYHVSLRHESIIVLKLAARAIYQDAVDNCTKFAYQGFGSSQMTSYHYASQYKISLSASNIYTYSFAEKKFF